MSGKPESRLEKILKPIRINPVSFGIVIAGYGLSLLTESSDNTFTQLAPHISNITTASFLGLYFWSFNNYTTNKRIIKNYKFPSDLIKHGKLRMEQYCDRQLFYVSAVENGLRNEALELINKTPKQNKRYNYLPLF